MPSISIIITNYFPDLPVLTDCWNSLKGKGCEVILISSESYLSQKVNAAGAIARGDFLLFVNDDAVYRKGDLEELCQEGHICCPRYNEEIVQPRFYVWCVSKKVFDKVGGYDTRYKNALYDDNDFIFKCAEVGVDVINVPTVDFNHEHPSSTISKLHPSLMTTNAKLFLEKWGRYP